MVTWSYVFIRTFLGFYDTHDDLSTLMWRGWFLEKKKHDNTNFFFLFAFYIVSMSKCMQFSNPLFFQLRVSVWVDWLPWGKLKDKKLSSREEEKINFKWPFITVTVSINNRLHTYVRFLLVYYSSNVVVQIMWGFLQNNYPFLILFYLFFFCRDGHNYNCNFFCQFTAVKFGRMSKKQREKVEDEVRYHRAQMKGPPSGSSSNSLDTAPDSSGGGYDHTIPSSSDTLPYNPHHPHHHPQQTTTHHPHHNPHQPQHLNPYSHYASE